MLRGKDDNSHTVFQAVWIIIIWAQPPVGSGFYIEARKPGGSLCDLRGFVCRAPVGTQRQGSQQPPPELASAGDVLGLCRAGAQPQEFVPRGGAAGGGVVALGAVAFGSFGERQRLLPGATAFELGYAALDRRSGGLADGAHGFDKRSAGWRGAR